MKAIKRIDTRKTEEMLKLASYAFNVELTEGRKRRFEYLILRSENYGYFVENRLASQVVSTPFKVNFHGVKYKMAGIGCVSSYPEFRGQGGISKIMQVLLQDQAEKKVALSYLAPFSYPFYRKYGFEQVFEKINYVVASAEWPDVLKVPGTTQRVPWIEAMEVIQRIYPKMVRHQRGAVNREKWWLEYAFFLSNQKYQFAVYKNSEGKAEGYLVYQLRAEVFEIEEWSYLSKEAFQALAGFIGSHRSTSKEFHSQAGFDGSNLSSLLPSPAVDMAIKPGMMARIVDLLTFLEDYPFLPGKQEVYYLEVEDEYGFWNNGQWKLEIAESGQAQLEKTVDDYGEIKFLKASIQKWTQLFLGYHSAEKLHFFDELSGDGDLVYSISKRLPKGKPVLEDHF